MADLLEQTMPELPVEGLFETKKIISEKIEFFIYRSFKKD